MKVQAIYSEVIENGRHSRAAIVGLGFQAELSPNFTVTPFLNVGIEKFRATDPRALLNGGVTIEAAFPLGTQEEGPALNVALRPEYTDRILPSSLLPGQGRHHGTFHNTAYAAIDYRLGNTFRSKISLVHQLIDGGQPTSSIFSAVAGLRKLTSDRSSYSWNVDVWFSRGNGDFSRVLLAFTHRFGFGSAVRGSGAKQ